MNLYYNWNYMRNYFLQLRDRNMRIVNYLSTRMGQCVLPTIRTAQLDNVPHTFFRPFGMQIVSFDYIHQVYRRIRYQMADTTGHHKDGEISIPGNVTWCAYGTNETSWTKQGALHSGIPAMGRAEPAAKMLSTVGKGFRYARWPCISNAGWHTWDGRGYSYWRKYGQHRTWKCISLPLLHRYYYELVCILYLSRLPYKAAFLLQFLQKSPSIFQISILQTHFLYLIHSIPEPRSISNMNAFTILSAVMFAAFAVAAPTKQAANEAEKAEVWNKSSNYYMLLQETELTERDVDRLWVINLTFRSEAATRKQNWLKGDVIGRKGFTLYPKITTKRQNWLRWDVYSKWVVNHTFNFETEVQNWPRGDVVMWIGCKWLALLRSIFERDQKTTDWDGI